MVAEAARMAVKLYFWGRVPCAKPTVGSCAQSFWGSGVSHRQGLVHHRSSVLIRLVLWHSLGCDFGCRVSKPSSLGFPLPVIHWVS